MSGDKQTGQGNKQSHPAFRRCEKHFKNRATKDLPALKGIPADLCLPLLDLSRPAELANDDVWLAGWWERSYGDKPSNSRQRDSPKGKDRDPSERPEVVLDGVRAVTLSSGETGYVLSEGCILVPGYLSTSEQLHFLQASLANYTLPPNPLSLSTHYALPASLFDVYVSDPDRLISPKHLALEEDQRVEQASKVSVGQRQLIETAPAVVLGYDEVKRRNQTWEGDAMSLRLGHKTAEKIMRELRWANLGWVYQWTTKSYDLSTNSPIPFPSDLEEVCKRIVKDMPWADVFDGVADQPDYNRWAEDYAPDTGIVNFYQTNDTLMAHVDRSELDPNRPLVSVSLGHSAIFLLGTDSRDDPPRPVVLRSGDVLIMSGKGRQAYHGVPRILEGSLPSLFNPKEGDSEELLAAKRFISTARINLNARQVFPPGFELPNDA